MNVVLIVSGLFELVSDLFAVVELVLGVCIMLFILVWVLLGYGDGEI